MDQNARYGNGSPLQKIKLQNHGDGLKKKNSRKGASTLIRSRKKAGPEVLACIV